MKKPFRILLYIVVLSSVVWILLTLWVQRTSANKTWQLGNAAKGPLALIVFNPDPIYNLDEQISLAFGQRPGQTQISGPRCNSCSSNEYKGNTQIFLFFARILIIGAPINQSAILFGAMPLRKKM